MKPLVLASSPSFTQSGFADAVLALRFFDFVWGPQPSQDELSEYLGPRNSNNDGPSAGHWSDWSVGTLKNSENRRHRDLSLADFCRHYETVELWFDIRPQDQLTLIWLLDYFKSYPEAVSRLKLRLVDQEMIMMDPDEMSDWRPPIVEVTEKELATASAAWKMTPRVNETAQRRIDPEQEAPQP